MPRVVLTLSSARALCAQRAASLPASVSANVTRASGRAALGADAPGAVSPPEGSARATATASALARERAHNATQRVAEAVHVLVSALEVVPRMQAGLLGGFSDT